MLALVPFLDLANIGGSGNMKFEMIDDGDSLEVASALSYEHYAAHVIFDVRSPICDVGC